MKRSQPLLVACSALFFCASAAQGQNFTLSNISLGMSEQQALGAVSQGFTIKRKAFSNLPMVVITAQKNVSSVQTVYKMDFVQGKLEAFVVSSNWPSPPQPLAKNIHDSLVQKLGQPTSGGDTSRFVPGITRWLFDNQGHLLQDGTPLTKNCTGTEADVPDTMIEKVDAKCGVSIEAHINTSSDYVASTSVYVINHPIINSLADQLKNQANAAKQQQDNKANQVKSPF